MKPGAGQATLMDVGLSDPTANRAGKVHRIAADTERAAAEKILPKTGTQRARVLAAVVEAGLYGVTDAELETHLNLRRSSICGRRNELAEGGWVRDSGKRRVDRRTGMNGIVWILTAEGRERLDREAG
jgi:hypothetical protein